jgi:hypothetical protein
MKQDKSNQLIEQVPTAVHREKTEHCGNCFFWENRPELEMDINTGFCAQKKAFKSKRSMCKKFCKKGTLDTSILLNGPGLESDDDEELTFYDN